MSTNTATLPAPAPRFLAGPAEHLQLSWRSAALIVLFGTSLLLINLGGNRVLTYHEVVFAQPAREMLATGNWIMPTIGGVPFVDKPPLTPWLIAASITLFGESEWAVRLPSVLAANLTALMIAGLAARWFGNRLGAIAGLMQFTTYYVLQLARLGECDIQLVAAVTGAMCCFALANVDGPRGRSTARWLPWAFYLATGLAFLIKGPIGPGFIIAGCLLFLLVSQDVKGLRFFCSPIGLAILLACIVPYCLMAYATFPEILDGWRKHNLGRFHGEFKQNKPSLFYLYSVPLILLPWFPLVAWTVVSSMRQGRFVEPLWRFAACWIAPGMTVLCLSRFKTSHYPAPLMPMLTIAAALGLVEFIQFRHRGRLRFGWQAALTVVACAVVVGVVQYLRPAGADAMCVLIAILGAGILAALECERRQWLEPQLAVTFAMVWLIVAGVHAFVMQHHDTYRDQKALALRVNKLVPPGQTLHMVALPENQTTYYLQTPVERLDEPPQFVAKLPRFEQQKFYVLAPERVVGELQSLGQVRVLDRCQSITKWMQPSDRLTLVELINQPASELTAAARREEQR